MRKISKFFKRLFRRAERNLDHILADFQATVDDLGRHVDFHIGEMERHRAAESQARVNKEAANDAAAKADAIRVKMRALISP